MPRDEPRRALAELERQLDAAPELDDDSRALLEEAQRDIQTALRKGVPPPNLVDRLRDGISRFESEHPILTETVNRLVLSML